MPKFFKIFGAVYLIGNLLLLLLTLGNLSFWGIVNPVSNMVLGAALFVLGEGIERLSDLEARFSEPAPKEEKDKIQQVVCPSCKNRYDLDYPECPRCGRKNDRFS